MKEAVKVITDSSFDNKISLGVQMIMDSLQKDSPLLRVNQTVNGVNLSQHEIDQLDEDVKNAYNRALNAHEASDNSEAQLLEAN